MLNNEYFIQFSIDWKSIKLDDADWYDWGVMWWFKAQQIFYLEFYCCYWISGVKNGSGCFWRLTKLNCAICFQYLAILYLIQSVNWLQWLLHIDFFYCCCLLLFSCFFYSNSLWWCYAMLLSLFYLYLSISCSPSPSLFHVLCVFGCSCVHACTNALDIYVNILNHIVKISIVWMREYMVKM